MIEKIELDSEISNEDFCQNQKIIEFYTDQLKKIEENRISRVETIKKFVLVPEPFSEENGMITPTLKLKRKIISKNFEAQIQQMYEANHIIDNS